MTSRPLAYHFWIILIVAVTLLPTAMVLAADSGNASAGGESPSSSAGTGTDFFAAIQNGDLDVKIIPRDSRRAQVIVKNNTDQPLTVKLPDAFVAVPVLAQQQGNIGSNNRSTSTSNNNNQSQSVGGGMGGTGGNRGGGGMFDIPPERVVKMQLPVVCLEYGKAEPNAHMKYTIESADKYTSDPKIQAVCKLLGDGNLDQRAAQAAAWHVANHMSWDDLANLKTFPHFPQYSRPVFSADELRQAVVVVDRAIKLADSKKDGGAKASSATDSTDSTYSAATTSAAKN